MRNAKINLDLRQLRELIQHTSDASRTGDGKQNMYLHGHWGRYLCVMVAGFLELSLQSIYSEFAEQSSSPQVARFVSRRVERISNQNAERFLQTAGAFDPRWKNELSEFFANDPDRSKDAIDSIMSIRNGIAHGRPTNITPARVQEYLNRSIKVLELIEDQCRGNRS